MGIVRPNGVNNMRFKTFASTIVEPDLVEIFERADRFYAGSDFNYARQNNRGVNAYVSEIETSAMDERLEMDFEFSDGTILSC